MAKVIEDEFGTMFVVELGVGPKRANNRDDVTVVQYLLNLYFEHPENASARRFAGGGYAPLKVDGIIGPKTNARIKKFQEFMTSIGLFLVCDGCVDKARADMVVPGKSSCLYTIFELNSHVRYLYLDGTDIIPLRHRADFPARLVPVVNRFLPLWAQWNAA
ncbi:peptidoglycan-binding domain-containing protein [Bosea sp. 124]|uniref:peptidoglycan-binding domain-containing protein n=1 Tax=Bosea sp. 124 TaxID=2135642 RepID=UPI000D391484|nr:peptidoglycan-binding domain-containing protein [Bosea sp. 124]PTM39177.1 hypothetical protein C8D03_0654 [Bosea sp. 124]